MRPPWRLPTGPCPHFSTRSAYSSPQPMHLPVSFPFSSLKYSFKSRTELGWEQADNDESATRPAKRIQVMSTTWSIRNRQDLSHPCTRLGPREDSAMMAMGSGRTRILTNVKIHALLYIIFPGPNGPFVEMRRSRVAQYGTLLIHTRDSDFKQTYPCNQRIAQVRCYLFRGGACGAHACLRVRGTPKAPGRV